MKFKSRYLNHHSVIFQNYNCLNKNENCHTIWKCTKPDLFEHGTNGNSLALFESYNTGNNVSYKCFDITKRYKSYHNGLDQCIWCC